MERNCIVGQKSYNIQFFSFRIPNFVAPIIESARTPSRITPYHGTALLGWRCPRHFVPGNDREIFLRQVSRRLARAMPMAAARTSCRSAGERAGVCQPHLEPVYLRVSAACLPNFFKSRSNVSRSFFERTLATSSIAAACSPNPRLISARPFGVS